MLDRFSCTMADSCST